MKEIELTQGKVALVDDEDFEWLNQWSWCVTIKEGKVERVSRSTFYSDGKERHLFLHRLLLGLQHGDKKIIDHANGNPLDNRKKNLRICTRVENNMNATKSKRNTSGFKGVSWSKRDKIYRVRIKSYGKMYHLGSFKNLAKAALVYNMAAIQYHGQFAYLNELPKQ